MKRVFTIIIAAATMLAACSKNAGTAEKPAEGFGSLEIEIIDATRNTRADDHSTETEIDLKQIYPGWQDRTESMWKNELRVMIASESGNHTFEDGYAYKLYDNVNLFNESGTKLSAGSDYSYVVRLARMTQVDEPYGYADPESGATVKWSDALTYPNRDKLVPLTPEGEWLPYFEGLTDGVRIVENQTQSVDVKVAVANTAVTVKFSDSFCNYFEEAHLTLETAGGYKTEFGFDAENPYNAQATTYHWINPRSFKVSGTVKRKSPGTNLEGETVAIEKVFANGDVLPKHCYTYTFDISNVGSAGDHRNGIGITVDDKTINEGSRFEYDLNDPANRN